MKKVLFILSELSNRDIDWLLMKGHQQEVPKGTVLIHEGKPIDALYIVLDGILNVSLAGLKNKEIAKISCGEVLGEMPFVDGSPPSATVKALENSLFLAINKQILTEKLEQDILFSLRFYQSIAKFLSYRLRGTFNSFIHPENADRSDSENNQLDRSNVGANLEMAQAKFDKLIQGIKQHSR